MEIKEITQKEVWESFLLECEEKTFLSSWNWGEFEQRRGHQIWRLGIFENQQLTSIALVVKITAKRGTFFLIPHGPVLKPQFQSLVQKEEVLKTLLENLKKIGREEKVDFIRISPLWMRDKENQKIFAQNGFRQAPIHADYTYESSWKLNITPSEDELLMNMRKTTRYLIRQALKNKDIEIFQSKNIEDVETFNKLYQEVIKIQQFVPFSFEFVRNEFDVFTKDNQALLFFGKYKGEIVASAFVLFWSKIGFYHHAALLPEYHKIPIAYSLLWEAIKEAKKRGCILFDFWGFVDPRKEPRHPWAGPTLFKMGFGGEPHFYIKTQDLPLSKKYWLTYLFEKLRKTKRGL